MNKFLFLILLAILGLDSQACTTAVVSGKATPDGRPLLWKHRDTWFLKNKIVELHDGKYACSGLVNSVDSLNQSIWIGFNEKGFAIMNSASYNLNNDTVALNGLEGRLMKQALQNCADIDEFEKMLQDMEKPTRLEANFGVIDAKGGAAYFELGNFTYKKFDANDPEVAPDGYIIRTNYSVSGEKGDGGGYIRYVTANNLFKDAVLHNNLTCTTILQQGSRNLTHSLTGTDLNQYSKLPENTPTYVFFKDFIPRSGSSSSCVVQGTKTDENPQLTTMWSLVGFPLTSVVVPVWLNPKGELPASLKYDPSIQDSPLCEYALELKKDIYSYTDGSHSDYYIDINKVINENHSGYIQKLEPLEDKIIEAAEENLLAWRKANAIDSKELETYYKWVDDTLNQFYHETFNLPSNEQK